MPKNNDEQKVRNKRQQKGGQQKNTRQKVNDQPEKDSDEPKQVKVKKIKKTPTVSSFKVPKRRQSQEKETDKVEVTSDDDHNAVQAQNEKKRPRQTPNVPSAIVEPQPKRRKVLVNKNKIRSSIRKVFRQVDDLDFTYTAGAQAAQTTLTLGGDKVKKKTSGNKHSEMGVLETGLQKKLLTITENGNIEVIDEEDSRPIDSSEFKTTNAKGDHSMDHCGYCTFMLTMTGVPTELPTFQPSVFAGAQKQYPIPDLIRRHPAIIAKALGFADGTQFVNETKEGIEAFYEMRKTSRTRIKDKSEMENFVELKEKDFTKWSQRDDVNQGAEKRFNGLLDNVFGGNKTQFLDSIWKPVIRELTTIMEEDEDARTTFLESSEEQ